MRPKIPLPPEPFTNEVEKVLEDAAKRKRIRAYAMAALPGLIQAHPTWHNRDFASEAFNIAANMETIEHERHR